MIFLPIVERELRVAARKRSTFWVRVIAALVALTFGSAFLALHSLSFNGRGQLGVVLFALLTWLCLATALAAGMFFTADCLSEEKREGTLGFLFLTDLRGYDVVLGKLLATSLRGFFALLAIFPVLAVTFVMGGIEGGQFWKTMLALTNALFFSLACGLFVSAVSRDPQRALGGTLLLLAGFLASGPTLDGGLAFLSQRAFTPLVTLASPGYAFMMANNWPPFFWNSLLVSHLTGWLLLVLACVLIPRTWQVKARQVSARMSRWSYWWRYGGARRRAALRQKLLPLNPILWLMSRERGQGNLVWLLSGAAVAVFALGVAVQAPLGVWGAWRYVGATVTWLFYLGMASYACAFFLDARRTGLMELLLAGPLSGKTIVQGQWRALRRMFGWAVGLFLCVQVPGLTLSQMSSFEQMSRLTGVTVDGAMILANAALAAVVMAANVMALGWFGMWMGMTSKNASFATLKTLLFVQIIPWFVIAFIAFIVTTLGYLPFVGSRFSRNISIYQVFFPVVFALLTILKDLGFCMLARRRLFGNFREMAVRSIAPVHIPVVMLPIIPRPAA